MRVLSSSTSRAILSLLLVVLVGVLFHADGAFYQWDTHRDMLRQISVFGILACGMTLVILCGGIDLSVGSLLGLTAVLFSIFSIPWAWPALIAIPACLIVGFLLGAASGGLIARFSIQPFIATLAMMVLARGLAKLVSGGQKISTAVQLQDGSYEYVEVPSVLNVLNERVFDDNIAIVTLLLLGCIVILWIFLSLTRWGRYLYAIGGNEEAARLSGIPVTRMKILAYASCGMFCALAGICQAAQELQGDPEAGVGYELTAIAIVVIGGTSLRGGSGSIWLTMLGILTIGYLEKILSINAIGEETRLILSGLIIVFAVLVQRRNPKLA
ncbi:MAG: ABC transporter permease [Bacteroidota bacterium]